MSTPREDVVAALRAALPTGAGGYIVRDLNHDKLGNIKRRTVTVQTTALAAPLTFQSWQTTVVVDVVSPHTDFAKAEPDLEAALPEVITALRKSVLGDLVTGAERIVRADSHHAWRITLTLPLKEA